VAVEAVEADMSVSWNARISRIRGKKTGYYEGVLIVSTT
jgi:hypothetical protein